MPRGVRFDRYDVPTFRGGSVRYPSPEPDNTVAELVGTAGKVASQGLLAWNKAEQKKRDLAEKVRIGERYLQASIEMEERLRDINENPEMRERAQESYTAWEETRIPAWGEGLTDQGRIALEEKLVEKRIGSQRAARSIEIKDLQQRTDVTITKFGRMYVEAFAKGASELPEDTPEFLDLKEAYGHAVAAGARDKGVAAKELLAIREEAAAVRAHRQLLGSNAQVQRTLDLFEQERQNPGSTYLSMLPPARRAAIEKTAKEEDHTRSTRRLAVIDRARKELDDQAKEQQAEWVRRTDTMLVNGELTMAWIEDGKRLQLVDDDKARFYRTRLEKQATGEEGPNHSATFRRLAPRIDDDLSNPRKLLDEVEDAYASGRLNWETAGPWRQRLAARIEKEKDTGRSEAEKQFDREATEVRRLIDVLTTTRSPFEKFDPQANRLKLSLLEDLAKLDAKTESPKLWYFKNQNQFYGRMRGLAVQYIKTERDGMLRKDYQTVDDIARNEAEYKRRFGADWESKMLEDVERIERINELTEEIESKKPDGAGTPGPVPSSASPAANTSPSSAPKPAQKSGGPLQTGRRSYQ